MVGSGLAGLVAATEIADGGNRVIAADQEGEQNIAGQALWSFGGLFLVEPPERHQFGIKIVSIQRCKSGSAPPASTATTIDPAHGL